jgi:hypothetical protein
MAPGARRARYMVRTAGHIPADIFSGTSSNWLTCDCSLIQGGLGEYVEDSEAGMLMEAAATSWQLPGQSLESLRGSGW